MPWIVNFDGTVCQIGYVHYLKNEAFTGLSFLVCVLLPFLPYQSCTRRKELCVIPLYVANRWNFSRTSPKCSARFYPPTMKKVFVSSRKRSACSSSPVTNPVATQFTDVTELAEASKNRSSARLHFFRTAFWLCLEERSKLKERSN